MRLFRGVLEVCALELAHEKEYQHYGEDQIEQGGEVCAAVIRSGEGNHKERVIEEDQSEP